jgi:Cu/Ag efflux pump CusA
VLAALVVFLGATAVLSMPIVISPEIDIPVVTIIWPYTGLSTPEMEQRVTTYGQYALSSSVNGIRDTEAQTLNGISVQKVFFSPMLLALARLGLLPPVIALAQGHGLCGQGIGDPYLGGGAGSG